MDKNKTADLNKFKITIIIPVYNLEKLLDKTLASVIAQTHSNLEIILVNDGSTDHTEDICIHWKNSDRRIRYYKKENEGVSTARNYGFSKSTGDYILFVDGDDEIAPDMCRKMIAKMIQDHSELCVCGFSNIFDDKIEALVPPDGIYKNTEVLSAFIKDQAFFTAVWNKLFQRSVLLDKNNCFIPFPSEISVGEDELWLSKVLKNVRQASSISEIFYFWKRRTDSATRGCSHIRLDEKYLSVLKAYKGVVLEMNDPDLKRISCKKYLGVSRDCIILAYKEKQTEIMNKLMKEVLQDLSLYDKIDLFKIKLLMCLIFVKIKAPIVLLDKLQTI